MSVWDSSVWGNDIVKDNVVENNGAGGVLFGGAGAGSGAYENTVTGNHISGNGLQGIAIHDHTPGQDFNGNNFNHNVIGTNGTPPGAEAEFGDLETTGIIVGPRAGVIHVKIEDNKISDNHFGIFTVNVPVSPTFASDNTFTNVTVPVSQS